MNSPTSHDRDAQEFDVVIVGAGPCGAALANLLGSHDLTVCVIDRNVGVLPIPRAVHIDGETMRVFQSMGLASRLLSVMRNGGAMHWVNAEGETLLVRKGVEGLGVHGWHNDYYYHQPDMEAVLREGLRRYPTVELREGVELRDLRQDAEGVELQVVDLARDKPGILRARYVVGCDGARSKVREWLGGDAVFEDLGEHQAWLVVDGVLNRPLRLPEHSVQHCDPRRPATSIYVHALRRRWELMLLPGEDPKSMIDPQKVWELVSRWVKPTQATLERAATYVFHSLVARRWQDGHILMAGDAAHQTPPFLGQGLCAAIRDVGNLGWKLAYAVAHPGQGAELLATYSPERLPHAREFVALAVDVGRVIQELDPAKAAERDARLLRDGVAFAFPSPTLGTGLHRARPGAPIVGKVAPQFVLPDGRWTDDVAGPRWTLLVDQEAIDLSRDGLHKAADAMGLAVIDATGPAVSARLKEQGGVAALLRPDRYVYDLCVDSAALRVSLSSLQPLLGAGVAR